MQLNKLLASPSALAHEQLHPSPTPRGCGGGAGAQPSSAISPSAVTSRCRARGTQMPGQGGHGHREWGMCALLKAALCEARAVAPGAAHCRSGAAFLFPYTWNLMSALLVGTDLLSTGHGAEDGAELRASSSPYLWWRCGAELQVRGHTGIPGTCSAWWLRYLPSPCSSPQPKRSRQQNSILCASGHTGLSQEIVYCARWQRWAPSSPPLAASALSLHTGCPQPCPLQAAPGLGPMGPVSGRQWTGWEHPCPCSDEGPDSSTPRAVGRGAGAAPQDHHGAGARGA